MNITTNTSLKPYNTFGIEVIAQTFCSIKTVEGLHEALKYFQGQELFILGGGSNMLLLKDVDKPVLHLNLKGVEIIKEEQNDVLVKAMCGENWHSFVLWCIAHDFGGIENLSLIPGNVGSAPIQNIGAYGVELKDSFVSCEAIHIKEQTLRTFTLNDCNFGYRDSVFKSSLKGQYIITSVTFKLTKNHHELKTSYGAITQELDRQGVKEATIKSISDAVVAIRQSKLPDPKEIGNSGSFFKNPVVSKELYTNLKTQFPEMPSYKISETEVKILAGWLIETAGFKGRRFGNYGVHKNQALVLVNYGGANGGDIFKLAQLIQSTIKRLFGIYLEMEVNII